MDIRKSYLKFSKLDYILTMYKHGMKLLIKRDEFVIPKQFWSYQHFTHRIFSNLYMT